MKTTIRRSAALFVLLAILAMTPCAYADSIYSDRWHNCSAGGYILIPAGFEELYVEDNMPDGCVRYSYYNWDLDMWLSISEGTSWEYGAYMSDVIDSNYNYYVRIQPDIVNKYKSDHSFALTGYSGENIYYLQGVIDHSTYYYLEIYYPTANRRDCDRITERVLNSFSSTGSQRSYGSGSNQYGFCGSPSAADLDRIHANVKYPNYSSMYLDHYVTATVTHRAVYCFRDPDRDIWRSGNYYTVTRGTEVTILATSQGYACVIINSTNDAGWINLDYLSY